MGEKDLTLYDNEGNITYASSILDDIIGVTYDYHLKESVIETKNGSFYTCFGDFSKFYDILDGALDDVGEIDLEA